jgi:transposase
VYSIRVTKTKSGARAVQVVRYLNRKVHVDRHIGSAHDDNDLATLKTLATEWIRAESEKGSLFESRSSVELLNPATSTLVGTTHPQCYDFLTACIAVCGFSAHITALMHDLIVMRLVEPASKDKSFVLLDRYFGITRTRQTYYKHIPALLLAHDKLEASALTLAQTTYTFDFSLVFYDVTTLYYESFTPDELRRPGFSKDGKSQQPQLVVGLVVTKEGLPLSYQVFPGNTFEGKTMLPAVLDFLKRHSITTATIVADAAMISDTNVAALKAAGLSYIVGGRLSSVPDDIYKKVIMTPKSSGACIRIPTDKGDLIVEYSDKRYAKDKHEMEKQLKKAAAHLTAPSRMKRTKFVSTSGEAHVLNEALIVKNRALLGLKGYYTNLPKETKSEDVIGHYRNLWQVEKSFRMAKSDLETRPIYAFTKKAIEAHLALCFCALVVGKHMELQSGVSLTKMVEELMQLSAVTIYDRSTKTSHVLQSEVSQLVTEWKKKLLLSY